MSDKTSFTDEPLPDAELVEAVTASSGDQASSEAVSARPDTMPGAVADHSHGHDHLPAARLEVVAKGYGHNDPASMAGNIQLDLHDPELAAAEKPELNQPIWGPSATPATHSTDTETEEVAAVLAKPELPPVLAHLTQVGLTSSDQWEEQIQPRLTQLHEDIAQVHTQLDMLERQKPKK